MGKKIENSLPAVLFHALINSDRQLVTFNEVVSRGFDVITERDLELLRKTLQIFSLELFILADTGGNAQGICYEVMDPSSYDDEEIPFQQETESGKVRLKVKRKLLPQRERHDEPVIATSIDLFLKPNWSINFARFDFVSELLNEELIKRAHLNEKQKQLLIALLKDPDHVITFYGFVQLDQYWRKNEDLWEWHAFGKLKLFLEKYGLAIVTAPNDKFFLGVGVASVNQSKEQFQRMKDALYDRFVQRVIVDYGVESENGANHLRWFQAGEYDIAFPDIDLGERPKPNVILVVKPTESRDVSEGEKNYEQVVIQLTPRDWFVLRTAFLNGGYVDEAVVREQANKEGQETFKTPFPLIIKSINDKWLRYFPGEPILQSLERCAGYAGYTVFCEPQNRVQYICNWIQRQIPDTERFWSTLGKFLPLHKGTIDDYGLEFAVYDLKSWYSDAAKGELPWAVSADNPFILVVRNASSGVFTIIEISTEESKMLQLFNDGQAIQRFGDFSGAVSHSPSPEIAHAAAAKKQLMSEIRVDNGMRALVRKIELRGYRWQGELQTRQFTVFLHFPHLVV